MNDLETIDGGEAWVRAHIENERIAAPDHTADKTLAELTDGVRANADAMSVDLGLTQAKVRDVIRAMRS